MAATAALLLASAAHGGDAGEFVAEEKCAGCHAAEAAAWRGSHHDLAMQEVGGDAVLGNFDGATFEHGGRATRFSRRGDAWVVTTEGPDGKVADFDVRYAFGVDPLQQLLLPLPGGRLQAFSAAWNAREKRWYSLDAGDARERHGAPPWTEPSQSWNFMCAECHSTDVERNYDPATDRYDTRFFLIDVGCQACHGPGAAHVAWAESHREATGVSTTDAGLRVDLGAADRLVEIEACARCHSRRAVIAPEYEHGRRLLDSHLPALLEPPLFHVDGQIRDEVYEYASFEQSRMASKGVRCSDCHDPHSARLRAEGNALCTTCHNDAGPAARAGIDTSGLQRKRYDSPEHHFHREGGAGSGCVDCHAPSTTYMGIDRRADHSFRIPRPDLSAALGVPDACTSCHGDRGPAWAAGVLRARGSSFDARPHFGSALHAAREGLPGAMRAVAGLAGDREQPAVVRATALQELTRYPGRSLAGAVRSGLADADPQVRRVAVVAITGAPAEVRTSLAAPLLADPVRGVRIEAARVLLADGAALVPPQQLAWKSAVAELEASHRANAERVEGRIALGDVLAALGRTTEAEASWRAALTMDPASAPASVNLADFLRARNDERNAEAVLREALSKSPDEPTVGVALALTLVRTGRGSEALDLLARLSKALPSHADVAYTFAAALGDAGRRDEALRVLETALPANRSRRELYLALSAFGAQAGDRSAAARWLDELRAINPEDPALPAPEDPALPAPEDPAHPARRG
jgi:predicted CXXCH cytochrome family protein